MFMIEFKYEFSIFFFLFLTLLALSCFIFVCILHLTDSSLLQFLCWILHAVTLLANKMRNCSIQPKKGGKWSENMNFNNNYYKSLSFSLWVVFWWCLRLFLLLLLLLQNEQQQKSNSEHFLDFEPTIPDQSNHIDIGVSLPPFFTHTLPA